MSAAYLYIDTRGVSRDLTRSAPCGARVAYHADSIGRTIEFHVSDNGAWALEARPLPGEDGPVETLAAGVVKRVSA